MNENEIREELRKLVILHNHPECSDVQTALLFDAIGMPITLGRVLQAFENFFKVCNSCKGSKGTLGENLGYVECNECGGDGHAYGDKVICDEDGDYMYTSGFNYDDFVLYIIQHWKLTKEGRECTADDQKMKTIKILLKFLK